MPGNHDSFAPADPEAATGSGLARADLADFYALRDGIYFPAVPVASRHDEFTPDAFEQLSRMQQRHFWYLSRHRFLLYAARRRIARSGSAQIPRRIVDIGGGCGGWLAYLRAHWRFPIRELALADSSLTALQLARRCLPVDTPRYQVDLLSLGWQNRWDLIFLLDVLEHIREQEKALQEIHAALSPGGLLFVTTPALKVFWTWNDTVSGHRRRYARADFERLAAACGYRCLETRYFMFFLSPLVIATRLATSCHAQRLSRDRLGQLVEKLHAVPHFPLNALLSAVGCCETPLGHYVPFPWGTSVLAVLQKPP